MYFGIDQSFGCTGGNDRTGGVAQVNGPASGEVRVDTFGWVWPAGQTVKEP